MGERNPVMKIMSKQNSKRFYWLTVFVLCLAATFGGIFVAQRSVDTALASRDSTDRLFELRQVGRGFTGDTSLAKEPAPLPLIIFRIVRLLLGMIGTILLVIILYGGWMWYSAGGSPDKVTDAKKTLYRAIIGMIIISMSYAIITFIFRESALVKPEPFGIGGGDPTDRPTPIDPRQEPIYFP